MDNQRVDRNNRISMQIVIKMADGRRSDLTFCRNLSQGGMFLDSAQPLPKGSTLQIEFTLPNNKKMLTLQGRVAWVRSEYEKNGAPGMGIKFEGISEPDRIELERSIAYLSALIFRESA